MSMGPVGIGLMAAVGAIKEARDAGFEPKEVRLSALVLVAGIAIGDGDDDETLVREFRIALQKARLAHPSN